MYALETTIEKEVRDISIRRNLRKKLIVETNFVKFEVRNHIGKDEDCLHTVDYADLSRSQGRFYLACVSNFGYCLVLYHVVNGTNSC